MEELQDLVRIISKERLKRIDILNNPDSHKDGRSRRSRFYHGILNHNIADDSDGRALLGYKEKIDNKAYAIFKFKFRKTLYNSLFFVHLSGKDLSDYDRAINECSRAQHQVRVLMWFSANNSAIKLCENMLAKAERFELAEFAVFFLRKLVPKTVFAEKKRNFYKYSKKLGFWLARWQAEENAIMAFYNLEIAYANTIARQSKAAHDALEIAKTIESNLHIHHSYTLILYMYRIKGIANYVLGNFRSSNEAWKNLEDYIIANPQYKADVRLGEIAVQQMINYLHLYDDKDVYQCANRCFHYFDKNGTNRMTFYEPFILLLMHKGNYKAAANTFAFTDPEIPWKEITDFQKARWKLVQAYLYLVSEKDYKLHIKEPFKFSKIINELVPISNDKKGLNVQLTILKTCMYLKENDDRKLFDAMEALKICKSKYIRKGSSKRTQIFVRMLLALEECNYDVENTIAATSSWANKLRATSYTFPGSFEGLEVVPFEHLWEMVLGYARKKK